MLEKTGLVLKLSKGKLTVDIEHVKATNGFDTIYKESRPRNNNKGKRTKADWPRDARQHGPNAYGHCRQKQGP